MANRFDDIVDAITESGEFGVAFDIPGTDGENSERPLATQNSDSTSAPTEFLAWGQLQDEILTSFLLDEEEWQGENLESLAKRLRSSVEEFKYIVDHSNPIEWEARRLKKLLEAESIRNKGFRWDQVEDLVLQKIHTLVEKGQVKKLGELLAIAQTANRASRRVGGPEGGTGMAPNLVQVNVLNHGGTQTATGLPGPGSLGVMRLSLSDRTVKQLSKGKVIDHDSPPLSERIEMLGPKDVPILGKTADEH